MNKFRSMLIIVLILSMTGFPSVIAEADSSFGDNLEDPNPNSAIATSRVSEIVVNSSGDASDDNGGVGVCETAPGNGTCTLRAAIETANYGAVNPVKIVVNTSVSVIAPKTPLPAIIQDNITIMGNGVYLSGLSAGEASGFTILGGKFNKIQGFNIFGFEKHGIHINGYTDDYNVLGVDGDGNNDDIEGNFIFSNGLYGVYIEKGDFNRVSGNYIGTQLGNSPNANHSGVWIKSGTGNLLGTNGDGISDTLERNVISGNTYDGIRIESSGNIVTGNFIGTDSSGEESLSNEYGIQLTGTASGNIIGTNGDGQGDDVEGNLISGNGKNGVCIDNGADNNWVAGNIIGLNQGGNSAVPNHLSGILVEGSYNTIGSNVDTQSDNFERNIISGNDTHGVQLNLGAHDNKIYGNYIGLTASGLTAIGNNRGIEIRGGADNNEIGCSGTPCRNVISGNSGDGIYIVNSNNMIIKGNWIGTDKNGLSSIPNSSGILLKESSTGNMIGGTVAGARNIISGNSYSGIEFQGSSVIENTVTGNYIGVGADGIMPLGNRGHGISLSESPTLISIGGIKPGAGNIIANNGSNGIHISGQSNSIRKNNIYQNDGKGIVLGTGANNGQMYPELSNATLLDTGDLVIEGSITSTPNMNFEIDYFINDTCDTYGKGEGQQYIDSKTLAGTPSGEIGFSHTMVGSYTAGKVITSTATDENGNTSEFSACALIKPESEPGDPVLAEFSAKPTTGEAPLLVNFVNLSTGDYDRCEWDFGDKASSKSCINPSHSYLTKGTYTVSLTVSGDGGTDTETKKAYIVVSEGSQEVAANFYGTPTSGQAPLEVTFSNQSTGDYTECSWDFGDGGSSLECDPAPHTYQNAGLYTVSLTVSCDGGDDIEIKADYITVSTEPVPLDADFSAVPTSGQAPLEVTFTNETTGDYDTCEWDFGDGDGSTLCSNIKHTYQAAGIYTVSLTVSGDGGIDEENKAGYITVFGENGFLIYLPLILR